MEKIGVYPGTFDPVTNGHLDIIKRSLVLFDNLIIAVAENTPKQTFFTVTERVEMLKICVKNYSQVTVESFSGLLVNYVYQQNASAIVKGLRAVSDFEHEFQMALMNRKLFHGSETIFMMTSEEYSYLSSSAIKEIALLGGDVSSLVPEIVVDALRMKI